MSHPPSPLSPALRCLIALVAVVALQGMAPDPRSAPWSLTAGFQIPVSCRAPQLADGARLLSPLLNRAGTLVRTPLLLAGHGPARTYRIVAVRTRPAGQTAAQGLLWPVRGSVSSGFGMRRHPITRRRSFHPAIDIRARPGTPVIAPVGGMVVSAGRAGGMGRMVKVRTASGLTLYFGHLSAIRCARGQHLRRGQVLGLVGSTGRSTGPHLHFSVARAGRYLDPMPLLTPGSR
ncbi:MAG: M23 family metallopeptidase [Candidatus Riflebacteria bacterium]|nr:M23 family metallopeptidase [Candidatus Riflebacteria bacterium]